MDTFILNPARSPETGTTGRAPHRAGFLALAALVLAFVVFYPYLNATGSCGDPGCPHLSHASVSAELPTGAFAALPGVVPAVPVLVGRVRRPVSDRKPADPCLPPDPEPPRS